MLPPHRLKIVNGCCGYSSRILRSRRQPIRSGFWRTFGDRAAPAVRFACRSRPNIADRVRYSAALVDHVRHLAQSFSNSEIADRLNQEGYVSTLGKPFTGSMVQWIRYRYQIAKTRLARPEELTVQQVGERFRVSPNVVYYWIDRGVIRARRINAGSPYWITQRTRRTEAPRLAT
jgi:hypothetical protein